MIDKNISLKNLLQLNSIEGVNKAAGPDDRHENLREAIALCHQQIKIDPNFAPIYLKLANLLQAQGKINAAIRANQQAVILNPYFHEAYFNLGKLFQQQQHFDQAIAAYIEVLAIQPDHKAAYTQLGDILRKIGDPDGVLCDRYKLPSHLLNQFYQNPRTWSILSQSNSRHQEVTSRKIHPATQIQLLAPKTLEQLICKSFQFKTFEYFPTEIAIVSNGRAWADYSTLAFLTSANQLIIGLSCGSSELIAASQKLSPPVKIAGTVAFLSVRWGTTYFHWMTDLLPRIELLRLGGIDLATIDKFVVNRYQLAYEKSTLAHFGIPEDKIIQSDRTPHIQAEKLLIPYLHYRGANWVGNFLRQEFLTDRLLKPRNLLNQRIYISRKSAEYRRVINEPELVSCLTKNFGFQSITLETMSLAEQVAVMATAEVVIAPHGAGLTNLVFCRPKTKVIEIFSPQYVNGCYWLLSHQVGIDYYYLFGERNPRDRSGKYLKCFPLKIDRDPDILVNMNKLVKLLESAHIYRLT